MKNIISGKELLEEARNKKTAIAAFNIINMEFVQAIVEVVNEIRMPVIFQITESALKYMGNEYIKGLIQAVDAVTSTPVAFHLDHGKSMEACIEAIKIGFSSVMIDKSQESFENNIQYTSEVVSYAKNYGVSVEAELGILAGVEDDLNIKNKNAHYTNPDKAQEFVDTTGIDSLAVAIGTRHGINKDKDMPPKLDIERLREIHTKTDGLPLVLHGASAISSFEIEMCNKYGANITKAYGIADSEILLAIKHGIRKINIDTDLRIAFLAGVRQSFQDNPQSVDVRQHLMEGKKRIKTTVGHKIKLFGKAK